MRIKLSLERECWQDNTISIYCTILLCETHQGRTYMKRTGPENIYCDATRSTLGSYLLPLNPESKVLLLVSDVSVVGGSWGPRAIQVICKDVNNDRDDIRAVNQAPSLSCWRRRWPLHHLLPSISISNAADSASIHSFASAPLSLTSAPSATPTST